MLVLGLMQLGNFWFNAAGNRRAEAAVTQTELNKVESRLDGKILALEKRVERKTDSAATVLREDFAEVFEQLKNLNASVVAVTTSSNIMAQKTISLEGKIDVLNNRLK